MTSLGTTSEYGQFTQRGHHQPHRQEESQVNVGRQERLITGGIGVVLGLYGLRRLSLLGLASLGAGAMLLRRAVSGHCNMYHALGISTSREAQPEEYFARGIHVEEFYTINRPAAELYQFWRNVENLPKFMEHLESVRRIDDRRSHWVAKGPAGLTVEWDAEIINDEPNQLISWKSLAGAAVDNAGTVRFEPAPEGQQGTQVRVIIDYIPPGGRVTSWFAKLFGGDTDQLIRKDLRRFKEIMEAAEGIKAEG